MKLLKTLMTLVFILTTFYACSHQSTIQTAKVPKEGEKVKQSKKVLSHLNEKTIVFK